MKIVEVRLKPSTYDWIKSIGQKEGLKISTMIRTFLEREEFKDEIKKNIKKKRK